MLRNYLTIALRNFQRQKLFALLNMFGLALGLASAILIFLYVSDELQYDVMHPYYKNTYRIGSRFTNREGQVFDNTTSPGFWLKRLKETRSEVVNGVRIDYIGYPTSLHHKAKDKIILTEEIRWAEPHFDDVLDFHLVKGNREKIFNDHNTFVVSETGARRLFGDDDPIGQIVTVKHNFATQGKEIDVMVTGVFRDYPANSHFKPKYILNVNALRSVLENFDTYMEGTRFGTNFSNGIEFFENYLVLKPGADIKPIEASLQTMAKELSQSDSSFVANGFKLDPFLIKMEDMHFDQKNLWEEDNTQGDKKSLAIFSSVAFLILLIACINYMNLATARSARRAKEVGLRKSLGSKRGEIAKQFFYESGLMTLGALLLALVLVIIFLQPFNQLAHKTFTVASLLNPYMLLIVLMVVVFMAFLSGSYPALYLSAFRPSEVLKGQVVKGQGAELFRKSLVTIQYAVSLVLIICTITVIRQMSFMQNTKLNEQGSQLLSIRYGGNAPQDKFAAFKQAVLQDKDIEHVTMANHLPRLNYFGFIGANVKFPDLHDDDLRWNQLNVDFDFPKTYDLEFVAGRDFDASNLNDSSALILNESAVKALNRPIEKIIGASVTHVSDNNRLFKVIGVVKDFPFRSMHQVIEPLMLNPRVHFIDRIAYIKLPPGKFQEKIKSIEKTWKEIFPGVGFDYWFLSDEFNRMYQSESRISSLAKSFAVLAMLITVMGVFGLASYTAEQKTKEVGIRKVLGAVVKQVVGLFVWVFVKIFLVASLIAVPAAYFIARYWLDGFTYRAPLSLLVFGASLLGLLVVTLLTISYETWKAARANPVKSLRSE
ncbi:ABC transporter permease [Chryseolinea lacunae]|uniref:ABC transporter permease n=1 Tax=Chryseolinea lacunae TaxID=2801331 RepID=A0ABS1KT53_9BACT|nr:ABC transporter permease [Chryseolinea lacunae]MBL0742493.1 ABC transporter permease [Chryseolinea lacunae]